VAMLGELFALTAWYILFSIWHKTREFVDSVSYLVAMSLSPTCDVMSQHKYKFQYGRSSMLICVNSISNSSLALRHKRFASTRPHSMICYSPSVH